MLKKVRVSLKTERYEANVSLFGEPEEGIFPFSLAEPEEPKEDTPEMTADVWEMTTEGVWHDDERRVSLRYEENELTGMEGARTVLAYNKDEPSLVSMTRGGSVSTALTFEEGKRYICSYTTPLMPFEVSVYTLTVRNLLETEGTLYLDYIIEIKGAEAEHCRLTLEVRPATGQRRK